MNTGSKSKNTIENLNTQLSTYSGSGVLQSIHLTKNCVLAISIRGKLNTRRTRAEIKASKNQNKGKMEEIRNQRKDDQEKITLYL